MDDLDRLHRRLVQNIRATRPDLATSPFTIRDLYERLVPYRHNRRELGIETNDEYETAVARLLSGERGYAEADSALQEALRRELASPTGDPGVFKEHADATVRLTSASTAPTPATVPAAPSAPAPQSPMSQAAAAAALSSAPVAASAPAMPAQSPPPAPAAALLESLGTVAVPQGCRFCGGTLPEGREVHYCPHCGENLRTQRCPACGAEMDAEWKFCVTCGRKT